LKSKYKQKIIHIYFRAIKWKKSVDEAVTFYDDGKIPSIIVENKVDLMSENEIENMDALQQFSKENDFNGCFKTSAKTGLNISESMEFLIIEIIKRLEEISSKENEGMPVDRQSVTLDPDKHNKEADIKRKNNGGCCG